MSCFDIQGISLYHEMHGDQDSFSGNTPQPQPRLQQPDRRSPETPRSTGLDNSSVYRALPSGPRRRRLEEWRAELAFREKGKWGMPRTDNDSWDITQSVGSTALGVAAARAAETESENPLINDPFARVFINAAGEGMWSIYGDPKLLAKAVEIEPEVQQRLQLMVDFMATRTAYFDEFFLNAADAGVRQVVILAAGLDARSWRLPWPETARSSTSWISRRCWNLSRPPCASTARTRRRNW